MENFHLEPNEELFSIIDRIKKTREDNITLVVPKGLSTLRSIINLRILKEEAISLGKEISIVTSDTLIKKLAQQSGLKVLDKVESEGKIEEEIKPSFAKATEGKRVMSDIIRPVHPPPFDRPLDDLGDKEDEFEELFEKPAQKAEPIEAGKKPSFKFFTKKRLIAIAVIICLVVGIYSLFFVLPRAQINISPKKETIRFETEIIVDRNTDSVNLVDNTIPGQVFQLEMEDSKKFPSTGEKELEEKAKGTIIVYNQYSSSPQTLVKTTRFLSEHGKLFRLIETTIIPGASIEEGEIIPSTKEVEVAADEAGENYNIGPANFTIPGFEGTPKYTSFYGKSIEPMTGGAKGKMRVATKDDIEGAVEIVSLELKNEVQEQFIKKIPQELKLLEDSQILEITEIDSSLKPDEPGKDFLVTLKARAWGLAFREEDVLTLIEENVRDKISENKILLASTIQVNYLKGELDLAQERINFSCQVQAEAAWGFDQQRLKNDLAGKNEIEVRKYLSSLSEIEGAKVIFWPFWVKKIPKNKGKIKIIIDID